MTHIASLDGFSYRKGHLGVVLFRVPEYAGMGGGIGLAEDNESRGDAKGGLARHCSPFHTDNCEGIPLFHCPRLCPQRFDHTLDLRATV